MNVTRRHLLAVLLVLALPGCGGSSSHRTSSSQALDPATLDRYLTVMFDTHHRTNPFPVQTKDDQVFNAMDAAPDATWTAAARSAHREAVNAQREAAAYTRITPPAGLGPAHHTYIAGLDAEVKAFDALQKAIDARSVTGANAAFNTLDKAGGKQLAAWKTAVLAACKRLKVRPPSWVADVGT